MASDSRDTLAIFSRRTIEVLAKDPVQMTLVGKATHECDLFEGQIVPSQMPARLFDFLFLNKGVRAYPVVSVEFAGELNRRAVADGCQFIERDVSGNIPLDIVFDQPGMSWPEMTLRGRHLELHRGVFPHDVDAGLERQRVVAESSAGTAGGDFVSHLFIDPAQDRVIDSEQVMKFNGADVSIEGLAPGFHHESR